MSESKTCFSTQTRKILEEKSFYLFEQNNSILIKSPKQTVQVDILYNVCTNTCVSIYLYSSSHLLRPSFCYLVARLFWEFTPCKPINILVIKENITTYETSKRGRGSPSFLTKTFFSLKCWFNRDSTVSVIWAKRKTPIYCKKEIKKKISFTAKRKIISFRSLEIFFFPNYVFFMTYNYCPLNWKLFRKKFVKLCVIFAFFLSNLLIQNEIGMPLDPVNTPWEYIPDKLGVQRTNLMDLYLMNTSTCNLLNLLFFLFSSIKYVFWDFSRRTRCEICSKFTIRTPENLKLIIKLKLKTPLTSVCPLYFGFTSKTLTMRSMYKLIAGKVKRCYPRQLCMYLCNIYL